jgi:hypothetical protein
MEEPAPLSARNPNLALIREETKKNWLLLMKPIDEDRKPACVGSLNSRVLPRSKSRDVVPLGGASVRITTALQEKRGKERGLFNIFMLLVLLFRWRKL